jgi:hypothetical protein
MKDRQTVRTTSSHSDPPLGGILQRKCACGQHTVAGGECSECEKKKGSLQRAAATSEAPGEVPPVVHEVLSSPGQLLDATTRAFMEPRFGHDFSRMSAHAKGSVPMPSGLTIGAPHDQFEQEAEMMSEGLINQSNTTTGPGFDFKGVRIHADARAGESARSLNALAYTVGQHIVFDERQYQPETFAGRKLLAHELTHVVQQSAEPATGVIARQAAGWSDATGQNKTVTTVDDKGKIQSGKLTTAGVWRVPIEGLGHGLQKGDKGPAIESSEKRAIALIPNTVTPKAARPDANIPVDVLIHLHGFGVGYRELRPKSAKDPGTDYGGVLKPGELRDVALYQMEQQLLSHVNSSNRLLIAVLAQGSEVSEFGDLETKSDEYLKDVFSKLIPTYLPEKTVPGRLIVSGHSGGGTTAMAIANQRPAGMRTDVLLFDAIHGKCTQEEAVTKDGQPVLDKEGKPKMKCTACKTKQFDAVTDWVTKKINADVNSVSTLLPDQQPTALQTNGTRFRGLSSPPLTTAKCAGYGYWYNELKNYIDTTIKKLKVSEPVRNQLRQNYKVEQAAGLAGLTGFEPHERMMGRGNLEAALKD